ncbi:MAG: MBL fold metallo-hydrolase [Candidatus Thermoplasmatota archaeon]|nr:MBL fold metallo-hydrolase [Candidatus Thermoplasmatota archaeon]
MTLNIVFSRGIHLEKPGSKVVLDPKKPEEGAIVSHGHMDHLVSGALMTPETRDILEVRKGTPEAMVLPLGERMQWRGMDISFHSAGHVLGSAMIQVDEVLYTGDFNPEGSFMSSPPKTIKGIGTLIMEGTYGDSGFVFPPKTRVLEDLASWMEAVGNEGTVIVGAYEFGKAQEIMNLGMRAGLEVYVPPSIARISEVYQKHGANLKYGIIGDGRLGNGGLGNEKKLGPGTMFVVPNSWLRHSQNGGGAGYGMVQELRRRGGRSAFVSGWCAVYKYFRSMLIDAQFPLSDHADHAHLISFAEEVMPEKLFITHSSKKSGSLLAQDIGEKLGIPTEYVK